MRRNLTPLLIATFLLIIPATALAQEASSDDAMTTVWTILICSGILIFFVLALLGGVLAGVMQLLKGDSESE